MKRRKDLKLVLMSATLHTKLFLDYFSALQPAHIHLPGFTYPVKVHYLTKALIMTGDVYIDAFITHLGWTGFRNNTDEKKTKEKHTLPTASVSYATSRFGTQCLLSYYLLTETSVAPIWETDIRFVARGYINYYFYR